MEFWHQVAEAFNKNPELYMWSAALFIVLLGFFLRQGITLIIARTIFKFLPKNTFYSREKEFKQFLHKPLRQLVLLIFIGVAYTFFDAKLTFHLADKTLALWDNILTSIYIAVLIFTFTWVFLRIVDFFSLVYSQKTAITSDKLSTQLIPFMRELVKIVIIILAIFILLGTVFKLNVASIIAGLGIGGLAVALAGKETLENLFASFTIFLDQPFSVGDFVSVNGIKGTVEKVGFRSTRIRTLDKTYLTLPNKTMVDSALDNITERPFSRVFFHLEFDNATTSAEDMEMYRARLLEVIQKAPLIVKEPQSYFTDIAHGYLKLMVLYFVNTTDEGQLNTTKQHINLEILRLCQELQIKLFVPPY